MDAFMAPSLGCQILRSLHRANGVSRETRLAESLRLGDPDPMLFDVPPGYSITTVTTYWHRDVR